MDDDLQKRIALTRPGQVTWAQPRLGKSCAQCEHLGNVREKRNHGNVASCGLVKAHTRKTGVEFPIEGSIACSMFEEK